MLRLDSESDLLPAQLGDSAAGPVHQPMQGGLPSVDEEVLLPWEINARINCEYSSGDRARLGQNSEGIKKFNIQHNILLVFLYPIFSQY